MAMYTMYGAHMNEGCVMQLVRGLNHNGSVIGWGDFLPIHYHVVSYTSHPSSRINTHFGVLH